MDLATLASGWRGLSLQWSERAFEVLGLHLQRSSSSTEWWAEDLYPLSYSERSTELSDASGYGDACVPPRGLPPLVCTAIPTPFLSCLNISSFTQVLEIQQRAKHTEPLPSWSWHSREEADITQIKYNQHKTLEGNARCSAGKTKTGKKDAEHWGFGRWQTAHWGAREDLSERRLLIGDTEWSSLNAICIFNVEHFIMISKWSQ